MADVALVSDLRRLGVTPGSVVMVHASLRAIGPVEGRAAGVVDSLDRAVGDEGTLLMVLGAEPDGEPFNCLTTPAEKDVGTLAEVFRTTPGTLVSDHPEGRFAARGRRAAEFVRDVPWDHYYGPGSPLERLMNADGQVLRLGADTNTVTLIHHAEYLAEVPNKRHVIRHPRILGPDGPGVRVVECLDDSNGIVDWPGEDYFSIILREFLAAHPVPRGLVGDASSELLPARELVRFAADWMTANLASPNTAA
jgi:aminoglycoside N3'-acetyltransferase